jgi:hypothetical protein
VLHSFYQSANARTHGVGSPSLTFRRNSLHVADLLSYRQFSCDFVLLNLFLQLPVTLFSISKTFIQHTTAGLLEPFIILAWDNLLSFTDSESD